MATARVPVDDFERGSLPAVCPITGDPTARSEEVGAVTPIGWRWLLLLLGVVPFVVVWALTRRTATGHLPISDAGRALRARRTVRRVQALGVALLGVPVALLGWYLADADLLPSAVEAVYGPVAAAVALGGLGVAAWFGPPTAVVVEPSGRWVRVEGASRAFADAVRAQTGAGRPAG